MACQADGAQAAETQSSKAVRRMALGFGCCVEGLCGLFSSSGKRHNATAAHRDGRHVLEHKRGQDPDSVYLVEAKTMATGTFGAVSKCKCRTCGVARVVKTVAKDLMGAMDEAGLQAVLDHPHICRIYETFEDHDFRHIVMERCDGGELFDHIGVGLIDGPAARALLRQILRAVSYMHAKCVAHRDLKPENFLLKRADVHLQHSTVKVIDFGLSAEFEPGQKSFNGACGTIHYMAPEMRASPYDEKCDLWSCGVILYQLLTGKLPFKGRSAPEVWASAASGALDFSGEVWGEAEEAKLLVLEMCCPTPSSRVSAQEALARPWMQGHAELADAAGQRGILGNLGSFSSCSRLKRAALHVVAYHLDDSYCEQLRDAFDDLDRSGLGTLTVEDLARGFEQLGVDAQGLADLFQAMDSGSTGRVGYTDFVAAGMTSDQFLRPMACAEAFRCVDKDGDGYISAADLLGDQGVEEACGKIDFQQFMALMREGVEAQ